MKELIISILVIFGAFFILVASIGLLRFRDVISRLHATTKATSLGILLLILGVTVYFSTLDVILKAVLIIFFIYLTAPLAAHSISLSSQDKKKHDDYTNSPK